MSKYIKKKDIKNALVGLVKSGKWLERETTTDIIKALGNLPTIDIVHCADCKHWNKADHICKADKRYKPETMADHFCSYGERIEE